MSVIRSKISQSKKHSNLKKHYSLNEESDDYFESIFLSVFRSVDEEISTADELMLLLQHAGYNPSKKMISRYWDENTESYSFTQFCSILKQEEKCGKGDLLKAFRKIDSNGDGFISHEELVQALTKRGERMTKAEVNTMIEDADFNNDGKLDYEEFCSMIDDISNQCRQLHRSTNKTSSVASARFSHDNSSPRRESTSRERRMSSKLQEQKRNSVADSKLGSKKSSLASHLSKKESIKSLQNIGSKAKPEKAEPKDLNLWQFQSTKGCFYKEEDDTLVSHQFKLKITQPTPLWITIKSSAPKYGKFNEEIMDSDLAVFLLEQASSKLIAFSDVEVDDGKIGLLADVDIGVYSILTFTPGTKLSSDPSESGRVTLVKGTGDDARLTKSCKDCLMEIFYRCDLDGNGFLNQREFDEFQKRTSGEECNDETWEIVKGTVDLTPHQEITPKGFLDLNLLEVRDPDGGQDELWITLDSLGYSNKLVLDKACPFLLEVFTKKGKNKLSLVGVNDGGEELQEAIVESVRSVSTVRPMKNKRDVNLHVANVGKRISIAVDNQTYSKLLVRIDSSDSENLLSNQGNLDATGLVESRSMSVIHHLVPADSRLPTKMKFQESIVHS